MNDSGGNLVPAVTAEAEEDGRVRHPPASSAASFTRGSTHCCHRLLVARACTWAARYAVPVAVTTTRVPSGRSTSAVSSAAEPLPRSWKSSTDPSPSLAIRQPSSPHPQGEGRRRGAEQAER